jgi:hypothetical protein
MVAQPVVARDSTVEAAETAEVFVYGRESKNEALLREISDPQAYDAMAKTRAESDQKLNENVRVDKVEMIEIDGDRAVARATYSNIHGKGHKQTDVELKRVDGKWEVTAPPEPAEE